MASLLSAVCRSYPTIQFTCLDSHEINFVLQQICALWADGQRVARNKAVFIEPSYLVLMAPSPDVCQAIHHEGSWAIHGAPPGDGGGGKDSSWTNAVCSLYAKLARRLHVCWMLLAAPYLLSGFQSSAILVSFDHE